MLTEYNYILKSHLASFAVCSEVSPLAIKDNTIIFTLTELIAVKTFDWRLISLFELNCLVQCIAKNFSFYLIQAAPLLHFFETPRRNHIMHRHKSRHTRQQGFAAIINLSNPGYNHLLYDVINNGLWCRLTSLI